MKVILQQEVKSLGKKGDILEVSDGYARNFLFPRKYAIEATASNLNTITQQKAAEAHKAQRASDEARVMASQLGKVEVTISVKTGEGGKLFGSVTAQDVAAALSAQHGIEMDKRKIDLKDQIKALGTYTASIKLHPEITAKILVHVTSTN